MQKQEHLLPEKCGYRIVRHLGSGGEGSVYLVCQMSTKQLRAAKAITQVRRNSLHELNMMKNLSHPSLPGIIDVLEMDEYTWLIMDYVQGTRLDDVVLSGMSENQIWSVAKQLSSLLIYLHGRREQILHLDIKPSNILIRSDGRLVLIDFGASIRGHPDQDSYQGYGTRGFAAPEQYKKGGIVDVRTDIYSAGAVLYYCIYRKAPGQNGFIKDGGRYSKNLLRIIHTCLSDNPESRYQDSQQFYKAVCKAEMKCKKGRQFYKTAVVSLPLFLIIIFSVTQFFADHQFILKLWMKESVMTEWESVEYETAKLVETETISSDLATVEQEYTRLLEMAGAMGFEQAVECFRQAAALLPSDDRWYLSLLEWVTADGVYDLEEETVVNELIYTVPSGSDRTSLELLREYEKEYGYFAFRMGQVYWYYYEGSGGKSAAAGWFSRAVTSQTTDSTESWLPQAVILARIGSYYGMLEKTGTNDERENKEWDYWKDLKELWYLYCDALEETAICSETAEELLSVLILKAYELQQYGESKEEMVLVIKSIEDFFSSDSVELLEKEREILEAQCIAAYSSVDRVFQDNK